MRRCKNRSTMKMGIRRRELEKIRSEKVEFGDEK
jgi:hypothetical protein